MSFARKLLCILTVLVLVFAAALPAFSRGENKQLQGAATSICGALLGDANQDGVIESADALVILRYALGIMDLSPEIVAVCDVNGDGSVDSTDALIVLRAAILGQEIPGTQGTVDVGDLVPVITIPLVYDTEYDPQTDYMCIEKAAVYGDEDEPIAIEGPSAYTVYDGRLIVLDAVGGLIRVYDLDSGEWLMNIDASASGLNALNSVGSVACWNGYYWIYSAHNGYVVAVDVEGNVIKTVPAPDPAEMDDYYEAWSAIFSAELCVIDGVLYLKTHGCVSYNMPDFKLEGDELVPCEPQVRYTVTDYPDWYYVITNGEYTWYIPTDEDLNFGCTVRAIDDEGHLYASCNLLTYDDMGRPHTEQSLCIYDSESHMVGNLSYEMAEPIDYGTHIVGKDTNGVWIMCCTEDEVRICVLPFEAMD